MEVLKELMKALPPMKVKVPFYKIQKGMAHFCSYKKFFERVKKGCLEWQDPIKLSDYLNTKILPDLNNQREIEENSYEITVNIQIKVKNLELEVLDDPLTFDYPRLEFNTPVELSSRQVGKLSIRSDTGVSNLDEYRDSIFEWTQCPGLDTYIITRKERALSELEKQFSELQKRKADFRKMWLAKFCL